MRIVHESLGSHNYRFPRFRFKKIYKLWRRGDSHNVPETRGCGVTYRSLLPPASLKIYYYCSHALPVDAFTICIIFKIGRISKWLRLQTRCWMPALS